jgi:two-component system NtrC family sensor kinase
MLSDAPAYNNPMRGQGTDTAPYTIPLRQKVWLKLVLVTALLLALALTATEVVLAGLAASEISRSIERTGRRIAEHTGSDIERHVQNARSALAEILAALQPIDRRPGAEDARLAGCVLSSADFDRILLMAADGTLLSDSMDKRAEKPDGIIISTAVRGLSIVAELRASGIRSIVSQAAEGPESVISVVAADGSIVARSNTSPQSGEPGAFRAESPIESLGWTVVVETVNPGAYPPFPQLLGRSTVFILIILAISVCLAVLFLSALTRPLNALLNGIRIVGGGSAEYRIPVKSRDEFGILSRSFNDMVESLQERAQALEESERKYRIITESVNDIIFSLDGQGRFVFLNRRVEHVLGYRLHEMIGKLFVDFVSLPEMAAHTHEFFSGNSNAPRQLLPAEVPFITKTGEEVTLECEAVPIQEPTGEIRIHGVARDITERKLMEERLRRTERLSALGEIVSGVAHELRNAVSGITASMQTLRMHGGTETGKDLERVLDEALRAQRIVHNLLDFSADRTAAFRPCSLNAVLEDALDLCRGTVKNAEIAIVRDLDPSLPEVPANAEQLRQVFLNLISNAIQAMQQVGGDTAPPGLHGSVERAWQNIKEAFAPGVFPSARGTLTVSTRLCGGMAVCAVSDTGRGIAKKNLPRIFDPFFTTKRKGEGTGLGLSVSLGIVKAHGGDIEAKSVEGEGTSFSVTLPVCGTVEKEGYPALPDEPNLAGKRILVVEDEDSIRDFVGNFLQGYGCAVDGARAVREAIAFLSGGAPYDLIVSDFRMPEIDGQGLYEWIRSNKPGMLSRLIYITGDGLNPLTRAFLARTGVPYLLKPVAVLSLIRTVWPILFGTTRQD